MKPVLSVSALSSLHRTLDRVSETYPRGLRLTELLKSGSDSSSWRRLAFDAKLRIEAVQLGQFFANRLSNLLNGLGQ